MTYLQNRKNPARDHVRRGLIVLLAVIVVLGLVRLFRPHLIPAIAASLAGPFWRTNLAWQLGALTSPQGLLQENELLKRRLAEADVRLKTVLSIEAENANLKAMLGRATSSPLVLAAVLLKPPAAAYDELIIDAGSDRSFEDGDLVYAPGPVLIGRISEVLSKSSKVSLFTSPGQTYDVLVGKTAAPATAKGRGGGQYQAELPRDLIVKSGDFVVAPSLDDKPFGVVVSVISDPARPFETILFAPPVNVYSLRWVLVDTAPQAESI